MMQLLDLLPLKVENDTAPLTAPLTTKSPSTMSSLNYPPPPTTTGTDHHDCSHRRFDHHHIMSCHVQLQISDKDQEMSSLLHYITLMLSCYHAINTTPTRPMPYLVLLRRSRLRYLGHPAYTMPSRPLNSRSPDPDFIEACSALLL